MIRAAYLYKGPAVSIVHSFKFRGRSAAATAAGGWMAGRFELYPELGGFDAVVPVPLHASRLTERGYNQADLLAMPISKALGIPWTDLLTRNRRTSPQWSLGRRARKMNLQGAFALRARGQVSGMRVLLVDDVATSGTSLEECAKALQGAGARSVAAYVFARQYYDRSRTR
jgi:ComF family protein